MKGIDEALNSVYVVSADTASDAVWERVYMTDASERRDLNKKMAALKKELAKVLCVCLCVRVRKLCVCVCVNLFACVYV